MREEQALGAKQLSAMRFGRRGHIDAGAAVGIEPKSAKPQVRAALKAAE